MLLWRLKLTPGSPHPASARPRPIVAAYDLIRAQGSGGIRIRYS